mmetsp:Transcript_22997/g.48202  ORF Transcript_22997/g.48202 Transcript_22997/m.48202 type:complete len:220 (-) Transcript_22997:613-1272(-)
MYFLYSSSVVAPMHRSCPRASIGLSRLPASMAPSVRPAPTTVWISSRKRITPVWESVTSLMTALSRSSNSPRYLAPATSAPRSSANTLRPCSEAGTSPEATRCARPSTMAVLPTPGSPSRMGLFLVRRDRICIVRRISSSRPITGSSLPALASSVRSRPYLMSASYVASGLRVVTFCPPRTSSTARCTSPSAMPKRASRPVLRTREELMAASRRCSTAM